MSYWSPKNEASQCSFFFNKWVSIVLRGGIAENFCDTLEIMNSGDFVWLFLSRFQSLWLLWWHKWHLFWLSSVSRWYDVIRWHDVISSLFLDPFGSTYRSKRDDTAVGKVTHSLLCTQLEPAMSHDKIPPGQVLEWISLLHEAWSLTSSTASSLDCQKRAVCEIWRWTYEFGCSVHTIYLSLLFSA